MQELVFFLNGGMIIRVGDVFLIRQIKFLRRRTTIDKHYDEDVIREQDPLGMPVGKFIKI